MPLWYDTNMRTWLSLLLLLGTILPAAPLPCRLEGDHARVPVRQVVEALGGTVAYQPQWEMATAVLGKRRAYFNALTVPSYPTGRGLRDGVLYGSLRHLADELHADITFSTRLTHVTIHYNGRQTTLPIVTVPAPRPQTRASCPLIDARTGKGALLGGAIHGIWVTDDDIAPGLGRAAYRRYRLDGEIGAVTAGPPTPLEDANGIAMPLNRRAPAAGDTLGLRAPWNAMPRRPVLLNPHSSVPREIARAALRANGLPRAAVYVKQAMQIDLYGDGRFTTLVCAASPRTLDAPWGTPGTYSVIAARTPTRRGMTVVVLEGLFCTKNVGEGYYLDSRIAGILDLDGDGVPEIVTGQIEYEGEGFVAYHIADGVVEHLFGSYRGL
jgi:hypothetical protein